ncbi:hypothetical protein PP2015_2006 [Pseudoalteromonas phenolica]|uniref:Uncharacterized protein n=1 Tax=Pseudoalteromonas phenolica TaxID=161398 RepID=A0A0S2K302_9GAMM|nr:hypothetical protein PP2015_2006 [Pseudoalteromonas phenolica]
MPHSVYKYTYVTTLAPFGYTINKSYIESEGVFGTLIVSTVIDISILLVH